MQPKLPRKSAKAPRKPTELRGSPQGAQLDATTNREKVRETVAPVRAPRQTLRSPERTSKKGKS
jgi:hypothetical protein